MSIDAMKQPVALRLADALDNEDRMLSSKDIFEAADELRRLHEGNIQARRTSEYWKSEHLAGNDRITTLETALRQVTVWCGCGDGIMPNSGAKCGNCLAAESASRDTEKEPVAWYVKRVAPGMRDDGTKLGPWFKKSDAEEWVDENHILCPLIDIERNNDE